MFHYLKEKIENELIEFTRDIDRLYNLKNISPLLSNAIKEYILRAGKRIRPILFVVGYLGFSKKAAPGLYRSALAAELLHDFMLIHDDIIDKSPSRRGKPSMHKMLGNYLSGYQNIKFNGQDLSLVVGDVMYAIAIKAFLSVKEDMHRKEKAQNKFIEAAIYTGAGEFIELLNGVKDIEQISRKDIYKIYDYKTSIYTFSTPLASGAILAGAGRGEVDKLFNYGLYLGRAFQIKDDILGMFGNEKMIGKSVLSDLQEAKRTILIWQAYNNSAKKEKLVIRKLLTKKRITKSDLAKMRRIIEQSGGLDSALREITRFREKAQDLIRSSRINKKYQKFLLRYPEEILSVNLLP